MILLLPVLLLYAIGALAADLSDAGPPDAGPPDLDALVAAIRIRGYACEQPRSPVADTSDTHPDRLAWIVRCVEGRYRVTFEGDTGPQVTPLD